MFLSSWKKVEAFRSSTANQWRKKNHEQLRMFHRATKKGGRNSSYTTQVMEKENCKIYARVNRLSRTKRSYQKKEPDLDDSPGSLNMYSHQNQEEG